MGREGHAAEKNGGGGGGLCLRLTVSSSSHVIASRTSISARMIMGAPRGCDLSSSSHPAAPPSMSRESREQIPPSTPTLLLSPRLDNRL